MVSTLLVIFSVLFSSSAVWTNQIYQQLYQRQLEQISVDNSAIVLGSKRRDALKAVEQANHFISRIENLHHISHLCALTTLNPSCVKADAYFEKNITSIFNATEKIFWVKWKKALIEAKQKALLDSKQIIQITDNGVSPLERKRCKFCNIQNGWKFKNKTMTYKLEGTKANLKVSLELIRKVSQNNHVWNYRLQSLF